MSWKKNQACCRTASRTALPLTTHCRASSSCSSWGQGQGSRSAEAPTLYPQRDGRMQLDGSGLAQWEAMQEERGQKPRE